MADKVFSSCEFNKIEWIITAAQAAWFDVMSFKRWLENSAFCSIYDLIIPFVVFVHNVIYVG